MVFVISMNLRFLRKTFQRILILTISCLILNGCAEGYPKKYFSKSIQGQVVNEENEPLDEVLILAYWLLEGGIEGHSNQGVLKAIEVFTGPDGYYYIPEWGPINLPDDLYGNARLKGKSPEILFYKEGYETKALRNYYDPYKNVLEVRESDHNEKVIKLKPLENNDQSKSGFNQMKTHVFYITYHESSKCQWQNIPKTMLISYYHGPKSREMIESEYSFDKRFFSLAACDDLKEFYEQYGKKPENKANEIICSGTLCNDKNI